MSDSLPDLDDLLATAAGDDALKFQSLPEFVAKFVLPNWRHTLRDQETRWCAKWWEHSEAILHLEALWEAFESLRTQPGVGASTFLLGYFNAHMTYLTGASGPLRNCSAEPGRETHVLQPIWPNHAPPPGMFSSQTPAPLV